MRELAFGPRCSGRTSKLAEQIIKDLEFHDKKVYVVASTHYVADLVRNIIRDLGGDRSRVIPVAVESIYAVSGVDPRNVYFEHTAYEVASSRQLAKIYEIEESMVRAIWGAQ